jgi:UDP-GlcNAc:undecaprenyl-phosphate/decaprenyl-phosphate GlcNAc-1-phosphate transferase
MPATSPRRVFALSFLDGADGLTAGVTGIIALGYLIFAGTVLGVVGHALAFSLLGACLGFLLFNFPPAKIFMGDSGGEVLGFSVAFRSLDFITTKGATAAVPSLMFPILAAALPLFDALLAILRRVESGRSPFDGDRRHFYDLLLSAGWSPRRVALSYLLTALLAGLV